MHHKGYDRRIIRRVYHYVQRSNGTVNTEDTNYRNLLPGKAVQTETFKRVLGRVLLDLKKQKKCYVKYEVKQRCFHITTRM